MPGPDWPVQLTHGTILAFKQGPQSDTAKPRLATAMEHLVAQGFHAVEAVTQDYPLSKMAPICQGLKEWEIKPLAGNGMHLAIVCDWM
eukprot:2397329-Alexandrium_andersonii.AAC.1